MVLLPGVISLTSFLTALQSTSFPLAIDFSWTKEIEDRLLAPLPTDLVAVEKIVYATLRALVAAVIMFPLAYMCLGRCRFPGPTCPCWPYSWFSARWSGRRSG
jgi:ABC-2 type transport system permease protein